MASTLVSVCPREWWWMRASGFQWRTCHWLMEGYRWMYFRADHPQGHPAGRGEPPRTTTRRLYGWLHKARNWSIVFCHKGIVVNRHRESKSKKLCFYFWTGMYGHMWRFGYGYFWHFGTTRGVHFLTWQNQNRVLSLSHQSRRNRLSSTLFWSQEQPSLTVLASNTLPSPPQYHWTPPESVGVHWSLVNSTGLQWSIYFYISD